MASLPASLDLTQHRTLSGVSWAFYEHTLEQIGNRPIRVNFLDGEMEIMTPLPEHEAIKRAIGRLIDALTEELRLPCKPFGSPTFRREDKSAGIEPDECFYFANLGLVRKMKRFDPLVHPAPDLAVEVDLFSSSSARESIYARLGVPEIWRYDGGRLDIRVLVDGKYLTIATSRAFPFLPMVKFAEFILPLVEAEDVNVIILEFRDWVRTLSAAGWK
jgi:Uma2 family endonuclease